MRFGINGTGLVQRASIDAIAEHAAQAAADGFTSYSLAEHPTGGFDALTVLTVVGQRVPNIELGTAIVPTMPRHPMVLAGQAQTTNAAIGGRLTLGIGLSHAPMMAQLGIGFDKPIRHLREYLSVLMPLLEAGKVVVQRRNDQLSGAAVRPAGPRCGVVVAALGPQALESSRRAHRRHDARMGGSAHDPRAHRSDQFCRPQRPDAPRRGSLQRCRYASPTTLPGCAR